VNLSGNGTMLCAIARRGKSRIPVWIGLLTSLASMGACAAVYGISRAAGAIPHDVLLPGPAGQEPLTLGLVLSASSLAATIATVLFLVLDFTSRRPMRRFHLIALVVFLVSLVTPFTVAEAPTGMIAAMLAMHVLTAGIVVGFTTALAEPVA